MKQRGFSAILILVGVLIMVVVAGGAYYFGRQTISKPQSQNPPAVSIPQVTSQPSPTSSPTPDETANWKTYTDFQNSFSLKYPTSWNQVTLADKSIALSPSIPKPYYQQTTYTLPGVILTTIDNSGNLSSRDYVLKKLIPESDYTQNAKITSTQDKVSGVIVEGLVNPVSGNPVGPVAYIAKKNKILSIELNPSDISNATSTFNQILSTFKFTN